MGRYQGYPHEKLTYCSCMGKVGILRSTEANPTRELAQNYAAETLFVRM